MKDLREQLDEWVKRNNFKMKKEVIKDERVSKSARGRGKVGSTLSNSEPVLPRR